MRFKVFTIILILIWVKESVSVQCDTNPCQLDSYFTRPNYHCIQLPNSLYDVLCTCPNGEWRINSPCRICDNINCGLNGICIERPYFPGAFHACGCSNSTGIHLENRPCSDVVSTTTTTTMTTSGSTSSPINCINGGVYNIATSRCVCRPAFTGLQCETSIGQEMCRSITCVNKGVCNPVPTADGGVDTQCWCINGFSGPNCELIGTPGRCSSNLCLNGGVCDERKVGASLFAYCQCSPGFDGQYCHRNYFICPSSGLFGDAMNCKFGRYFECIDRFAIIRSCPKGLRFNAATMQCDSNGSCPS